LKSKTNQRRLRRAPLVRFPSGTKSESVWWRPSTTSSGSGPQRRMNLGPATRRS